MSELLCDAFLIAFLFFYSALFLVLLGWGLRGSVWVYLKKARRARAAEYIRGVSFSPLPRENPQSLNPES
jgi:hypothetical protein